MRKIAIYNRKGGVGKTVSCVNIAGCLDKVKGKKVLVIDTDAQANATSYLLQNDMDSIQYSLCDLFRESTIDPHNVIYRARVFDKKEENLIDTNIYVVPATTELDEISAESMFAIKDFLDMVEDEFDYCLIDCSPSITEMTINALCAADYLVIPSLAGRDSVTGYGMVIAEIDGMKSNGYNVNLKILGVFLNAVDKRRALDDYYRSFWTNMDKREHKVVAFVNTIRNASDVVNAQEYAKPIHYFRSCNVAKDYEGLVQELEAKIGSHEALLRKKG